MKLMSLRAVDTLIPTTVPRSSNVGPPLIPCIQAAGEQDAAVIRLAQDAAVGAGGDGQPEIERIAHCVKGCTFWWWFADLQRVTKGASASTKARSCTASTATRRNGPSVPSDATNRSS